MKVKLERMQSIRTTRSPRQSGSAGNGVSISKTVRDGATDESLEVARITEDAWIDYLIKHQEPVAEVGAI